MLLNEPVLSDSLTIRKVLCHHWLSKSNVTFSGRNLSCCKAPRDHITQTFLRVCIEFGIILGLNISNQNHPGCPRCMPGYQLIENKWKTLCNQLTLSFVIISSHYIVKIVHLNIFTFHIVCSKSDITVMLNSKTMKSSKSSLSSVCSSSSERRSLYFGLVSCPCKNKKVQA